MLQSIIYLLNVGLHNWSWYLGKDHLTSCLPLVGGLVSSSLHQPDSFLESWDRLVIMVRAVLITVGSHGSAQTLHTPERAQSPGGQPSVRKCKPVIDLNSYTKWKNWALDWNMIFRILNQSYHPLWKLNMLFIRFGLEKNMIFSNSNERF